MTYQNPLQELQDGLQAIVADIARDAGASGTPRVELSRPTDEKFGDFASNVALMLAPVVQTNPREVAQKVAARAAELSGVAGVDVAGPGFVNLTLADAWFLNTLAGILAAGDRFGADVVAEPQRINIEYVSANPLGPLVAVAARHAAYGDALARLLRRAGNEVETEYYVNDAGRQVQLFGESILARATGGTIPEGGYEGDYVADLATELGAAAGDDPAELGQRGVAAMLGIMRPALERFGITYDRFQSELELHDTGAVEKALALLQERGHLYDQDGATMLRTTAFGDDKDRAVRRSNGVPTYFAADIGYMQHKYARGYDHIVYVLGADHHGYVARLKAAAQALGHDPASCEIVIMQMVQLVESGELKRMSKRRGDFVTMDELMERISVDAARFFMLQRSHDQSLEVDLDLAGQQSDQNPVYYVQYAHARICSIMRKAADELGIDAGEVVGAFDADAVEAHGAGLHQSERRMVKRLAELPVIVREAAERRQPHKLTHYAHDLAMDFSRFYRDCRVVGDDVPEATTRLRIALCAATRDVLALTLGILGVSAPDRM
jgi:arginyl-tRNA synthetase